VKARREGRMIYYSLDDHHITNLLAEGLRHVEE
jgi:DNA-binding transcriptional ArsR family regulator